VECRQSWRSSGGTSNSTILPQWYRTGPGHDLTRFTLDPTSFLCPSRRWGRREPGELATSKTKSSGEDPRATGGLVSNLSHPRVIKTKQRTYSWKQANREGMCVRETKVSIGKAPRLGFTLQVLTQRFGWRGHDSERKIFFYPRIQSGEIFSHILFFCFEFRRPNLIPGLRGWWALD